MLNPIGEVRCQGHGAKTPLQRRAIRGLNLPLQPLQPFQRMGIRAAAIVHPQQVGGLRYSQMLAQETFPKIPPFLRINVTLK